MSVSLASMGDQEELPRRWSRFRYPGSVIRLGGLLGALALIAYSLEFLNVDLSRLLGAFPRLAEILATRYYPPDLAYVSQPDFLF